jgi:transcriptional regulator with XRE-family HTH domain
MQHGSDISRMIACYMRATGESQAAIAERAGVSQAAVSRALNGTPERNGKARAKLFIFMQQAVASLAPPPAVVALRDVWDGSEEHALALAALITASGELWPKLREA